MNNGLRYHSALAGGAFFSVTPLNRSDREVHRRERLIMEKMQFENERRRALLKIWRLFKQILKLLRQPYREGARLIRWIEGNLAEQELRRPMPSQIAPREIRMHRHRCQCFVRDLRDGQNKEGGTLEHRG